MSVREKSTGRAWLGVYTAIASAFLSTPILIVIPAAFGESPNLDFPPHGLSLRWFQNAFAQANFVSGLKLSVELAVSSTFISLFIGGIASYALVRYHFHGKKTLELMFLAPLAFPAIIIAVALTIFLSSMGFTGTFAGILFAHVLITLPFAIKTLTAGITEIDKSLEEAATTLGAGSSAVILRVILPLLRPSLISAATFCLIMSFDEFTVSLFLTKPGFQTLPIALYAYTDYNLDPTVAAVSAMLLIVPAIVLGFSARSPQVAKHLS